MTERRLALAIQKPTGKTNLGEDTEVLLRAGGLKFSFPSREDDTFTNIAGLDIWLKRNGDLTRGVADGEAALGIVGLDKFYEYSGATPPLLLKNLGYSDCILKLGVREGMPYSDPRDLEGATISTSYPRGSARFFEEAGVNVRIRKYDGGAETAVKRGFAEACIEVSETGYSMKVNGIRPVADVLESQAVLIANPDLDELTQGIVWNTLRIVMTGLWKTQYGLMKLNFPLANEEAIMQVLPSRESPTTMDLKAQGWSAAETLVPLEIYDDVERELLNLGARDILRVPVERIIPNLDDPEVTRMMRVIYGEEWQYRHELLRV